MANELILGQQLGHWRITSRLGAGGMGAVYLAEHAEISRRVAIKVLSSEVSHQHGIAERFLAEARAVARIDHPNVVSIYDFGRTEEGQLYYVMEWLRGSELSRIIEERAPLDPAEVNAYLAQICAGLQAAHEAGIVHRDLKPENIFVLERRPLTVKILDFGIARLLDAGAEGSYQSTQTGIIIGSPLTMSPEQAAGRRALISSRTDLYSLGVILYWMLAGRPPFVGESVALMLADHIRTAPPSLAETGPGLPAAVVSLVHRCLEKSPEARPACAEAVAEEFARALAGAPALVLSPATRLAAAAAVDATLPAGVAEVPATRIAGGAPLIPTPLPGGPVAVSRRGRLLVLIVAGVAILATASQVGRWVRRAQRARERSAAAAPSSREAGPRAAPEPSGFASLRNDASSRPVLDGPPPRRFVAKKTVARKSDRIATQTVKAVQQSVAAMGGLPTPQIIIGLIVTDGLPRRVAHRAVALCLPQLSYCYRLALGKSPDLIGRVVLEVAVSPGGAVRGVRVAQSNLPDTLVARSLETCMAEAVQRFAVFPRRRDGARLEVPFVLRSRR